MEGSVFQEFSLEQMIQYGIAILFFLSILLAVLYTVWGAFLMVISAGNEEKVKSAVNHIRYAVLGISVLVIILIVSPIFLRLIGLGMYAQYFQPATILQNIKEVSSYFFGASTPSYYEVNPTNVSPESDDFTSL